MGLNIDKQNGGVYGFDSYWLTLIWNEVYVLLDKICCLLTIILISPFYTSVSRMTIISSDDLIESLIKLTIHLGEIE